GRRPGRGGGRKAGVSSRLFLALLLFVEEFAPQQFARVVRDLPQPLFQGVALLAVQRLGAGGLGRVRVVAGAGLRLAVLRLLLAGVILRLALSLRLGVRLLLLRGRLLL